MDIKNIKLDNIGQFESLDLRLAPCQNHKTNITVLIGNNGSGKTSILKALSTSLSWFVARLRTEKGTGNPIPEEAIFNNKNSAAITLNSSLIDTEDSISWTLTKTKKGKKAQHTTDMRLMTKYAKHVRELFSENEQLSFPLIAYYPVERVVIDIPLKIRGKHNFLQIDGYDNSLNKGIDFRRFFEWFREREDTENETSLPPETINELAQELGQHSKEIESIFLKKFESSRDSQLSAVRKAIETFMPGFKDLRVRRKPKLHMSITKNGETLNVSQLSQGEKSLMALVGDIARRLAIMNPALKDPLTGDGIVLIDEIDMHLHPTWQRNIVERLTNTFPNCQFVLTTHSPLVISDYKDILVYSLENGECTQVNSQYGQDVNTVLLDVMDTHIRNTTVQNQLSELLNAIQDNQLDEAKRILNDLNDLPENNLELIKARFLLKKKEIQRATHK